MMKRIALTLTLTIAALSVCYGTAAAQSGTVGDISGGSISNVPIQNAPVMDPTMGSGIVEGAVQGVVEPAPQPIPADNYGSVQNYGGEPYPGDSYGGEVVSSPGIAAGGCNCGSGGGTTMAAPMSTGSYQSYSPMPSYDYSYPTYNNRSYGYRPLFGGLFSRRNNCCCQ